MIGDTATIRALGRRLRERADEIRDLAAGLARRADSVPWTGLAADAMRAHTAGRVAALLRTAALHEEAADAIERHAREVDLLADVLGGPLDQLKGLLT